MFELLAIEKWITGALQAQPEAQALGTRAYAEIVPEGAAFPAFLFSRQSASDTVGGGAVRILTQPVYYVRAVVSADCFDALGGLANAVDRAMQATPDTPPVTLDGVVVRGAYREQPMIGSQADSGVVYTYAGGMYRIFAYAGSEGN